LSRAPGAAADVHRETDEQGSGVLGTCFGVLFFLGFLLVAAQITIGLYARSTVGSAALDAGRIVSRSAGPDGELDAGELRSAGHAARVRVRELLGDEATFALERVDLDAGEIEVAVQAPRPRLLLGGGTLGSAVVERRVVLRLEVLR